MGYVRVRFVLLGLLASPLLACGRTAPEPPIAWQMRVAPACEEAKRQDRPLLFLLWASWDVVSKELDHVTFEDARVRRELREGWIALKVDRTDVYMAEGSGSAEEREVDEAERRFRPRESKSATLVMMAPDCATELGRVERYEPPSAFLEALVQARGRLRK